MSENVENVGKTQVRRAVQNIRRRIILLKSCLHEPHSQDNLSQRLSIVVVKVPVSVRSSSEARGSERERQGILRAVSAEL